MLTSESVEGAPRTPTRRYRPCRSIAEVFEALGGKHDVCRLTKKKYTAVCNWETLYRRIPARLYLKLQNKLKAEGYIADPTLFGME